MVFVKCAYNRLCWVSVLRSNVKFQKNTVVRTYFFFKEKAYISGLALVKLFTRIHFILFIFFVSLFFNCSARALAMKDEDRVKRMRIMCVSMCVSIRQRE